MRGSGAWVVSCGVVVVAIGCGGGDSGQSHSQVTAPPGTPAADLSAADVAALCAQYDSVANRDSVCRYLAVTLASQFGEGTPEQVRANCEAAQQGCIDDYDQTIADVQEQCESNWFGMDCAATVADVEACFRALPSAYQDFYDDVGTCAGDLSTPIATQPIEFPASCIGVIAECPTFFQRPDEPGGPDAGAPSGPAEAACVAACDAYVASCSLDECPDSCGIMVQVYGEACAEIGERFYDCAATSAFDCAETDLLSAPSACGAERVDYLACYSLGSVTCMRETGFDDTCSVRDGARPYGKQCVSDAAPDDCELYAGFYYCCATE